MVYLAQVLVLETFPAVLAHEIARAEVRLDQLHERLAARGASVSLTTLSHWRRGQVRPELDKYSLEVALLEELLGLRAGRLAGLLLPRRK